MLRYTKFCFILTLCLITLKTSGDHKGDALIQVSGENSSSDLCGSDYWLNEVAENDPELFAAIANFRAAAIEESAAKTITQDCTNPIIIPVAVHYNTPVNNSNTNCLINAALNQIEQLNLDFSNCNSAFNDYCTLLNACPNYFIDPNGGPILPEAGACIQFCLGDQNLPGNEDNIGGYAITEGDYLWTGSNGDAGSNWNGFMNIFVGNYSPTGNAGTIGVAPLTGALLPQGNGVFVVNTVFGAEGFGGCNSGTGIGTSNNYGSGGTTTHEVGHYFGLQHPFDGDGMSDTPPQTNANFGCASVNLGNCTTSLGNDYSYNFMDYLNDACKSNFTADQTKLMQTVVNNQAVWNTNAISCYADWQNGTLNYNACNDACDRNCPSAVLTSYNQTDNVCTTDIYYDLPSLTSLSGVNLNSSVNQLFRWSIDGYINNGGTEVCGNQIVLPEVNSCAPEIITVYLNGSCLQDRNLNMNAGTLTINVFPDPSNLNVTDLVTFSNGDCDGPTYVLNAACASYISVSQNGGPNFPVNSGSGSVNYDVNLNYPPGCCSVAGGSQDLIGSVCPTVLNGIFDDAQDGLSTCALQANGNVIPTIDEIAFDIPPALVASNVNDNGLGSIQEICVDLYVDNSSYVFISVDAPTCGGWNWENIWVGDALNGGTNSGPLNLCFTEGTANGAFDGDFDGDDGSDGSFAGCDINNDTWIFWIANYGCANLSTGCSVLNEVTIRFDDGTISSSNSNCSFSAFASYNCEPEGFCDDPCYAEYAPNASGTPDPTLCITDVSPAVSINGLPSVTSSNSPLSLNASPSGGSFNGPGVIFNSFNPSIAGPGLHTINYDYTDSNGCSVSTSEDILVLQISYNFVSYNLGTIAPKNMEINGPYSIYNLGGQIIDRGIMKENLNLNHLKNGSYIIQFWVDDYLVNYQFLKY